MDWQRIGYDAGRKGGIDDALRKRLLNCAPHQSMQDRQSFTHGFQQGTQAYCTPEAMVSLAHAGRPYPRVCPTAPHSPALLAYSQASNSIGTGAQIQRLQSEIKDIIEAVRNTQDPGTLLSLQRAYQERFGRLRNLMDQQQARSAGGTFRANSKASAQLANEWTARVAEGWTTPPMPQSSSEDVLPAATYRGLPPVSTKATRAPYAGN